MSPENGDTSGHKRVTMNNNNSTRTVKTVKKENIRRAKLREVARLLRNIFVFLTLTALVTLVVFSLWLTAFRITRDDMSPAVQKGDLVIAMKKTTYVRDDIIAFYHNNDIFIKRIAAIGGDEITIDENGMLFVNGIRMDDEYAVDRGSGDCDITFPYEVPKGKCFVLGDNRGVSEDSRLKKVGSVSDTLIIGKVLYTVSPFSRIGIIE